VPHGNETAAILTICLASALGMLGQVIGSRWRIPPIVFLLLFGVAAGPSGLGWLRPDAIGAGLPVLVKLAVAIILFEGALNLRLGDLRGALLEVRRLVTVGVLITGSAAALVAYLVAGFRWQTAIVFGALVSVTGPTVVQPLLKRVELPRRVRASLEGEAILVDPIGAILAVAVFDIVLGLAGVRPIGVFSAIGAYVGRIVAGIAIGVPGGLALSWLLRQRRAVTSELANLVSLAGVWVVFGFAELLQSEAGIMAVVAMGLAMQREVIPEERRLRRFKEQLTVLGISLLFILLAADLPLSVLRAEGWKGVLVVAILMFAVRPIAVFTSLLGSPLTFRERAFIAWIGPRGIVAASVASLFALTLDQFQLPDGSRLLALTFLTIAMTVTIQGLTVSLAVRALSLHATGGKPVIVVGAGPLGLAVAGALRDGGRPVTVVDRNVWGIRLAQRARLEAIAGNALDESVLEQAGADEAELLLATTTNSEVNALAAQLARDRFGIANAYPALGRPERGATEDLLIHSGARLAFGRPLDVRRWDALLESGRATLQWVTLPDDWTARSMDDVPASESVLPVARMRGASIEVTHSGQRWERGDRIATLSELTEEETGAVLEAPRASLPKTK
jgi:NhaP-type Na+/H+ or K+/H+ antiporter